MSGRRRFGAVRKLPSGRYPARYSDPRPGLQRSAPHTFATKTEAGRWLATVEADMRRGGWVDPRDGEMRFNELAERWFATKVHLRENTRHQYRYLLDKHVLPFFGERPIGSITVPGRADLAPRPEGAHAPRPEQRGEGVQGGCRW